MAPLLRWGLPTSQLDDLLFGGDEPWPAERYDARRVAEQLRDRSAGADTDLDPLGERDRLIDLTPDDAARAAILLRYRLYSRQPDEMITFRALQRMDPRNWDLDPQLFQYGGAYVYAVGAALGLAAFFGITRVTGDIGVYLTVPEWFASFYTVARCISLLCGAALLAAVVKLARRAAGRTAGWIAFVFVAASPVFVCGVLEAKPHLPSVCFLLWAILAALDYHATHERRHALRMGLFSGCAFGLVLTGLAAVFLWPALLVSGAPTRRRRLRPLLLAGGIAAAVYLFTNPYIPYNLLFDRQTLASNLGNSTDMYSVGRFGPGALRVGELLIEGAGVGVVTVGLLGFVLLLRRFRRETWIGALSGVALLLLCVAIGAGKPAEFARFLLLPAVLLCVAAAWALATLSTRRALWSALATVLVLATMRTPAYWRAFALDAGLENESRRQAALYLRDHAERVDAVAVLQAPAPYAVPPLDFTRRRVVLLSPQTPRDLDAAALPEWLVFTADDSRAHDGAWWSAHYEPAARFGGERGLTSRIAWANKPVFLLKRKDLGGP